MADAKINLDRLLKRAFEKKDRDFSVDTDFSECLTAETLQKLCDGKLTPDKQQQALEHLDKCTQCCKDLAFYCEVVGEESQAVEPSTIMHQLTMLKRWLNQLTDRINPADLKVVCRKILTLTESVKQGASLQNLQTTADQILDVMQTGCAQLTVQVRGESEDIIEHQVSIEDIQSCADQLQQQAEQCVHTADQAFFRHPQHTATADLWIIRRMDTPLQKRAVQVRHWCQEKIEQLTARGTFSMLPSVGISHAARKLAYIVELIRHSGSVLQTPFESFLIYASVFCEHIGLIMADPLSQDKRWSIYCDHADLTCSVLLGDRQRNMKPAWPDMGFESRQHAALVANICQAVQKGALQMAQLPQNQTIFAGGKAQDVCPLAIGAALKLAAALECHPDRLPALSTLTETSYPDEMLWHLIKNETVQDIGLDAGQILIKIRQQYQYPPSYGNVPEQVGQMLKREISETTALLAVYGLRLPEPTVEVSYSLFLDEHPYLQ